MYFFVTTNVTNIKQTLLLVLKTQTTTLMSFVRAGQKGVDLPAVGFSCRTDSAV